MSLMSQFRVYALTLLYNYHDHDLLSRRASVNIWTRLVRGLGL